MPKSAAGLAPDPEALRAVLESFLSECQEPRLLENGQPLLVVDRRSVQFLPRGRWLQLEAWDGDQFLSRRVTAVRALSRHRLELTVERFGGKAGTVTFFDAARPANVALRGRSLRQVFGETFRGFLHSQFAGWKIEELSSEPNLQHSLSPAYPRAFLKRGGTGWAAIAAAADSGIDSMLAFGLIWLDYLRRREPRVAIEGLALWLPAGSETATALRLRCLDPSAARWMLFRYTPEGRSVPLDLADFGNLYSQIEPVRERNKEAPCEPEAILESQVRSGIQALDATLMAEPVYAQVPALAAGTRGILDLLACDRHGRLAVLELKAGESVHLPLQALDYWMRVRWHLERGDFTRYGYFPRTPLSPAAPRLLLVAPALEFHPSNERVVRFFDPAIEVERIGVAGLLHGPLKVMFRQARAGQA